jgi:DNA-directed RNA polymerase omega subunit
MKNTTEITTDNAPIMSDEFDKITKPEDSMFQLVILASTRCKQLRRGANSRLDSTSVKRKNTSIAIEETKQGLVPYRTADLFI